MNTIGNMIYVNQNQTTTSTHIANKIATDDMQSTLQAQLSQESKELKDQDVVEVEVQNDISDYLKEQNKQNLNQKRQNQKNDKDNKGKIDDNNTLMKLENQQIEYVNSNNIFSSFDKAAKEQSKQDYKPLDIKI